MKKINILKRNEDFARIIKKNNIIKTKYFLIFKEDTTENIYHFGLSISKKIGNAVVRNKYKRQIKSILDKKIYKNNFNCIIILKKGSINVSFNELNLDLIDGLKKHNIIEGDKDEKIK